MRKRGTLPSTVHTVSGRLISPAGQEYVNEIIITNDTGIAFRATLVGNPPVWTFAALPNVADIRADFNTVLALTQNVPTVAALRTWGFA